MNPDTIIDFWFGKAGTPAKEKFALWYGANAQFDLTIKQKFEGSLALAKQNKFEEWKKKPSHRLAIIILLDQFPRNIYRKQAKAFYFDDLALLNCKQGLKQKQDQELNPTQRSFFYMPLQHSENIEVQEFSLKIFKQCDEELYNYAVKHYEIIKKFNRFPHRNQALGRESTQAELDYLKNAETFGQ